MPSSPTSTTRIAPSTFSANLIALSLAVVILPVSSLNTLIIRGEGGKDWEDEEEEEEGGRIRYSSRLDLPPTMYKVDEIKAEMKNGVLKVVVPKVKEEERKDVYQVTVE
ncbi:Heat shock 22 kDa, mitochondrial [Gossypium arboreum]|uniref:Heat shock 22 kDa, mitochondrial n=1 Tax=Gossypium arboreum TaxID=29729 RepID=A0A0B0MDN9_GOSAR|nr:Heat shock 22 kDa, mitochondrial [Gossypium arboreum]